MLWLLFFEVAAAVVVVVVVIVVVSVDAAVDGPALLPGLYRLRHYPADVTNDYKNRFAHRFRVLHCLYLPCTGYSPAEQRV